MGMYASCGRARSLHAGFQHRGPELNQRLLVQIEVLQPLNYHGISKIVDTSVGIRFGEKESNLRSRVQSPLAYR